MLIGWGGGAAISCLSQACLLPPLARPSPRPKEGCRRTFVFPALPQAWKEQASNLVPGSGEVGQLNEPPGQAEFPLWFYGDLFNDLSLPLSLPLPLSPAPSLSPHLSLLHTHTLHKISESGPLARKGQNKLRERSSICKALTPCLTSTSLPVTPCTVVSPRPRMCHTAERGRLRPHHLPD